MPLTRGIKTRIGELLLKRGLITPEQLQQALYLQQKQDRDKQLGQILVELGFISRNDLYFVLAIQSGYPYINLDCCNVEPEILSLIPEEIVRKHQVLPIDKIQDVITVAMVNPLDSSTIERIQKITKSSVKVFLTTPLELEEIVSRYYGHREE